MGKLLIRPGKNALQLCEYGDNDKAAALNKQAIYHSAFHHLFKDIVASLRKRV